MIVLYVFLEWILGLVIFLYWFVYKGFFGIFINLWILVSCVLRNLFVVFNDWIIFIFVFSVCICEIDFEFVFIFVIIVNLYFWCVYILESVMFKFLEEDFMI